MLEDEDDCPADRRMRLSRSNEDIVNITSLKLAGNPPIPRPAGPASLRKLEQRQASPAKAVDKFLNVKARADWKRLSHAKAWR
jgi:hypothetical protein